MERIMKFIDGINNQVPTPVQVWATADFAQLECKTVATCAPATPKKKGKAMSRYYDEYNDCYVDSPAQTDAAEQRNYFKSRVQSVQSDKYDEFRRMFGLMDDASPQTPSELVKRIQDGKYVLSKETEDKKVYDPVRYISWRDPSVKKDEAGFDAASEAFSKEVRKTTDAVMALSADKAMEAVQALEAWTPPTSTAS